VLKRTEPHVKNVRNKYPIVWWMKWSFRVCINKRRQEGPIMSTNQTVLSLDKALFILKNAAANSTRKKETTNGPYNWEKYPCIRKFPIYSDKPPGIIRNSLR